MKKYKVLSLALIPLISLVLFLVLGNSNSETAIIWGMFYMFATFILSLVSIVLILIQKYRKDGLYLLLSMGLLTLVGFGVCSGMM